MHWLAPREIFRPTLGRKFAVFSVAVLLVAGVNGWAIDSALSRLHGTAALINVAGSLRWLSQRIQADALSTALRLDDARQEIGDDLARAEEALAALERGGRALGFDVGGVPTPLRPLVEPVRAGWASFRDRLYATLAQASAEDAVPALRALREENLRLLRTTDQAVAAMTAFATGTEREVRRSLYALALLDLLALALFFLVLRNHIQRPLRRLVAVSAAFAAGRYGERTGIRARDEIGALAQAYDRMAERIRQDMERIAQDERRLKESQQTLGQLSRAVEHSPVSVMITDAEGHIEYVNPKFTEITGYAAEDVLGCTPGLLKSGYQTLQTYTDMWRTLAAGGEWRGELLNRKKDGELFWENTRISSLKDEGERITHYVAVKEDVTERRRAEEALARFNAELERRVEERTQRLAQANQELQAFSYSVSHDLRAPLRAIDGFSHAMRECCADCTDREAPALLDRIRSAARRMDALIDGLLDLARIARTDPRRVPIDLSALANAILDDLRAAEPGRRVDLHIQSGLQLVGDAVLIRSLVENLLGNAWKFTRECDSAAISLRGWTTEDEQVVCVSDNGAGFDMAYADKLFGVFQRLHHAGRFEGSGIGLATAQRIVRLHGGRMWAEGSVGAGARFYFALPVDVPVETN